MKSIIKYLNLKNVGLIEFLFSITPLLSGYNLSFIPMSSFMWVLMLLFVFIRNKRLKCENFMPLSLFVIYWLFRCITVLMDDNFNLMGLLMQLIWFFSVFALYSVLDINKIRGSMNWIALISIIGLLFQWSIISSGGGVKPLAIPGFVMDEVRMTGESIRPSSFFMEPAAYVAFMICPLQLALTDKKYLWAIAIILSIFLTTSSTGLILSFVMLGMTVFTQKFNFKVFIGIIFVGLSLYYVLTSFKAFEFGVNKLETTNVETNVRLAQGVYVVSTMHPDEYFFGVPFSSPYNYCKSGRASDVIYYGESVYMSTIWLIILCFGIVGLLLYLNIYWRIMKRNRITIPLIVCLVIAMFSSSYAIGSTYIFTLVFLLVLMKSNTQSSKIILNSRKINGEV